MAVQTGTTTVGGVTAPRGFYAAGTTCGIKDSGRPDMAMIVSDRPCSAAGVFTKNRLPGAPVIVCKRHLRDGGARAIVVNSGVANDATGAEGIANAIQTCRLTAEVLDHVGHGLNLRDILPSSTGVIGPQLPMDKIAHGVTAMAHQLGRSRRHDRAAAQGIMTTDLVPKQSARALRLGRRTIHLGGIAKGSGMIAPNMATMLVFLTTDATISPALLRQVLRAAVATSFNRISIDQHTSPSDMALLLANGSYGGRSIRSGSADHRRFADALTDLCRDLAYQIVRDGEGATRVIRVRVSGARSEREADRVGQTVVNSPLVKCAVHGADPNWGRIVTAAANSGVPIQPANLSLQICGFEPDDHQVMVFDRGTPVEHTRQQLRQLHKLMKQKQVVFAINLGRGRAAVEWLGCDLSRQYVAINADYTT